MVATAAQTFCARTRYSSAKAGFLCVLAKDLRRLGIEASTEVLARSVVFRMSMHKPSPDKLATSLVAIRNNRLRTNWGLIDRLQRSGIACQFARGATLNLGRISPTIELCTSKEQWDLFEFCRVMQTVPAQRLLYRRMAFLVRDAGQANRPLMGVLGLSSMVYSLGCRDAFLHWTDADKSIKEWGLNRCMQLTVCMPIPPYSYLRAGKLLAAFALGSDVATEFTSRYSTPLQREYLLGILTSAANGLHSPIFNRISIRPGGLFRRIGATVGYTALPYGEHTVDAARDLVRSRDGICYENRTIRTLKRALNICGLPREFFVTLGVPKGVYWGAPDRGSIEALRMADRNYIPSYPSPKAIIEFWLKHVQKTAERSDLMAAVRQFEPTTCSATKSRGFFDVV